jgi:tetratricopeptide (TPR) repeat protein
LTDARQHLAAAIHALRCHDLDAAEIAYGAVLAAEPADYHALSGLGIVAAQRGALEDAASWFARAIEADPVASDAQGNLAQILFRLGRHDAAEQAARQALALNPQNAGALNTLGLCQSATGRRAEAAASFERAASLATGFADPQCNLAELARRDRRYEAAITHARRAVELAPNRPETQLCLGQALTAARQFDAALIAFEAALRLRPGSIDAVIGLGTALSRAGRIDQALARVAPVAASHPELADVQVHLGDLLLTHGESDAALSRFRAVLSRSPDYAPARLGEGTVLALKGDLAAGFARFERRFVVHGDRGRADPARRWQGEDPAGRTIMLWSEQGFGDTIQFSRYAPIVARLGARIVLEVQPALKSLLSGLAGIEIVSTDDALPAYDLHCPLMSLPALLGTTLETIPASRAYLVPDADPRAAWQLVLAPLRRRRIGLVWAGHPDNTHDAYRSLPLARFLPLVEASDDCFVALQKDQRPGDAALLGQHFELLDLAPRLGSFADTAAVISLLDLVISVDSAVCHLAGALGVPVWTLLPAAPDWRWLEARADSPWYPSMRLFRQTRLGDWDSVIEEVSAALSCP